MVERRRSGRAARAALAALLLAAASPVAGREDAAARYAGRPLADVLLELQSRGLTIVFTSELVRPEMKVRAEPVAHEPRRILDEVLAAHGLGVEEAPGGVLVVVARPGAGASEAAIEGTVLARGSREGLAGAVVRVVGSGQEARARTDGSFALFGLPAGTYALEASAPGYLPQRLDVPVRPGAPRQVELRLLPQPFYADEIVVRPSRLALLHERPDSSLALGKEEIESLPHLGDDVFRTAALLPGTAAGDVTAQFSVHGGRRDEVRVLLDGQELYDAYHLKDYDNALSLVPARLLAGATLTTGAYPASQGDRMSGVLDLRTAEPPAGRHYLVGLSVLDALVSSAGTFAGGKGSWLAAGRRGALDLAGTAIGKEDPSFWDLFAKAGLDTGAGRLDAHVLTAGDGLAVERTEGEDFESLENDYRSTYGWLNHQAAPGGRLLVETLGSWAEVRRDRRGTGSEQDGSHRLRDRRDLEALALSQTWSFQLAARHLPQWGWELHRYDAAFDNSTELEPEFLVVAPFAIPRVTAHAFRGTLRGDHLGAWASDRFSRDRLTAELGARYDRHTATGDTLASPRANLAWRLGERAVLRAAWGRFFQSQRPYELQVEDGESTLARAELSEHRVLGYEALPPPNRLGLDAVRLELFHRGIRDPRPRYENLLEPVNFFPEIEPDRVRIAPERSRAQGLELLLRGRRGARLGWWLAYSWARVEDRLAGDWVPRSLDQPHTVVLDLDTRLPRSWSLNLAWKYHSGWPTTPITVVSVADPEDPEETGPAAVFGPLNGERLPAYHRLDLRASRRFDLRRGRLTFFADVQNLYDRRNLAGFDAERDEDTVLIHEERWPGVFPSLGITWEF